MDCVPPFPEARIVIIGAGPTGLGAAHRLSELGKRDFLVLDRNAQAGGLASSFVDCNGFTWDIGGHVQFSHYDYFDRLMDALLGDEWLRHEREAWVWMRERFIPYPFQNNIRRLPTAELKTCLAGLIGCLRNRAECRPANFEEWILQSFGEGIARCFLLPYNFKVWAYPPAELGYYWTGDRVAEVDLERIVLNIVEGRDDLGWGPNDTFRFPLRGGTGEAWRRLAGTLPKGTLSLGRPVERVDVQRRRVHLADGSTEHYDILISTMPVDDLVLRAGLDELKPAAARLRRSATHAVGVGLKGAPPPHLQSKCWIYFPESESPFYRITVFSNYSPNNVPDSSRFWSLMLETSESPVKPVDSGRVVDRGIAALVKARLIEGPAQVVSTWHYRAEHGYPTPLLARDQALEVLLPGLERYGIFSRGRFGAWKYEVSNQDHSLMQGVELVNRLAGTEDGDEVTLNHPGTVNSRRLIGGR